MEMEQEDIWRRLWSHNVDRETARSKGCVIHENATGNVIEIYDNLMRVDIPERTLVGVVYDLVMSGDPDEETAVWYCLLTNETGRAKNLSTAAFDMFKLYLEAPNETWED